MSEYTNVEQKFNSSEKCNFAMKNMINDLDTCILYKYRADDEYTENIIINNTLWFSRPKEFNDPFDCYSVPEEFSEQDVRGLLHNQKATENDIKNVMKGISEISIPDVKFDIDEAINKIGISCFSITEKEILMWSHYSDSHKGLCLKFDINEDPNIFQFLEKVKYETSIKPLNCFKEWTGRQIIDLFIVPKYDKWSYEQEVRAIKISDEMNFNESDKGKAIKFKPSALIKIIFGCKATQTTIEKYKRLCNVEEFKHVKFSKMEQMTDGKFGLIEKEIY